MKTTITPAEAPSVSYPRLVKAKASSCWTGVYAIEYTPGEALVVRSSCHMSPGQLIKVSEEYFEPFYGSITLES